MAESPPENESLEPIRRQIDELDERIQEMLSERAQLAQRVGASKHGPRATALDFYRPDREARILQGVVDRNQGPLSDEEMIRLKNRATIDPRLADTPRFIYESFGTPQPAGPPGP